MKFVLVDGKYINLDQVISIQKDGFRMSDGTMVHIDNSNLEKIIRQLEVTTIKMDEDTKK